MPLTIPCICVGSAPIIGAKALLTFSAGVNVQIDEFDYSVESVVAGTALGGAVNADAAVRASTFSLFAMDGNPSVTKKYNTSTKVVTAGANLQIGLQDTPGFGSSSTLAFFIGSGNPTIANSSSYTFATDAVAQITDLLTARRGQAAVSNGTSLYNAGGDQGAGGVTVIDKYSFSNGGRATLAATLSAGKTRFDGGAQTVAFGIYPGGATANGAASAGTATIDKITFATEARSAGTALGANATCAGVASGASFAIMAGAGTQVPGAATGTAINKYNWTTEAISASAATVAAAAAAGRVGV